MRKYNNYKETIQETKETKDERLERMIQEFLKESKERQRGSIKEHTKADTKAKKEVNAERRRIALRKRNKRG